MSQSNGYYGGQPGYEQSYHDDPQQQQQSTQRYNDSEQDNRRTYSGNRSQQQYDRQHDNSRSYRSRGNGYSQRSRGRNDRHQQYRPRQYNDSNTPSNHHQQQESLRDTTTISHTDSTNSTTIISNGLPSQLTTEATSVLADNSGDCVLFIRNLPKNITGKQLMFSLFVDDGDAIQSINIHRNSETGESLGTAEVIVDSLNVAQRLVYRYHNANWDNHILKLSVITDESVQHEASNTSNVSIPIIQTQQTNKPVYSSIITQPTFNKQQHKLNKLSAVNNSAIVIPQHATTASHITQSTKPIAAVQQVSTTTTTPSSINNNNSTRQPITTTSTKKRLVISKNGKTIDINKQQRKVITKAQKAETLKHTIVTKSNKTVVKRARPNDENNNVHTSNKRLNIRR